MAPSLCENCHQRPQFGTHRFCGKTCAAQAAAKPARSKQLQPQAKAGPRNTGRPKGAPAPQKAVPLCSYCGQKPKFNNFDYCGKSCAALAGATQTKPPATQGVPTTKQKTTQQKTMRPSNSLPNNVPPPSPAKPNKAPRAKVPVPQADSTEEDEEPEEDEEGGVSTDLDAYPSDSGSESEDEPSVPDVAAPKAGAKGSKPGSGVPRIVPGTCAIPGCGQPSHVDRHGVKTMYCSVTHREEAVKLGLEAACIMCQRYPQSTSDYFCSSACRNQSMTKT